jgi:hypothetical protein
MNIKRVNARRIAQPENGFLVADGSWYAVELPAYRDEMPYWSLFPPPHWRLLYTVRGKKIEGYGNFDPKIYRILPQNLKEDKN